jgi:hypothetical protein
MEAITIIKDLTHNKQFAQIEIESVEKLEEQWDDFLDVIIAEMRKDDEKISWDSFVNELKSEGKL